MALLKLTDAYAVRENAIRLFFSEAPYYTQYLDPGDSWNPDYYTTSIVPGTIGLDNEPVRPVLPVVLAKVTPTTSIQLDLTVDRPMTRYPSQYTVTVANLKTALGSALDPSFITRTFYGLSASFTAPTEDAVILSRDLANPQTISSLTGLGVPSDVAFLGKYIVDASGDYASDSGLAQLKKRIFRRLLTRQGSFAHAPTYGIGLLQLIKHLATSSTRTRLLSECEVQLKHEPGVSRVRVKLEDIAPGVVRLVILVRTNDFRDARFAWDVRFSGT